MGPACPNATRQMGSFHTQPLKIGAMKLARCTASAAKLTSFAMERYRRGGLAMLQPDITRRGMIGGIAAGAGLAAAAASGKIVGAARGQSTPKTFVLVHGAWHGGWC